MLAPARGHLQQSCLADSTTCVTLYDTCSNNCCLTQYIIELHSGAGQEKMVASFCLQDYIMCPLLAAEELA